MPETLPVKEWQRSLSQVAMMRIKIATVIGLMLFFVLSLADLGLTWFLIGHSRGRVRESNPVAHAWLEGYGWHGLVWFKAATSLVVAVVVVVLLRYRPRAGLLLVIFACLAAGSVVLYSYQLVPQVFGQSLLGAVANRETGTGRQENCLLVGNSLKTAVAGWVLIRCSAW